MLRSRILMGVAVSAVLSTGVTAQTAPAPAAATPAPAAQPLAPPAQGEGVAAVVNDEIISTYDLRQRLLLLLIQSGAQPNENQLRQFRREALQSLVDERLQMQELRRQ